MEMNISDTSQDISPEEEVIIKLECDEFGDETLTNAEELPVIQDLKSEVKCESDPMKVDTDTETSIICEFCGEHWNYQTNHECDTKDLHIKDEMFQCDVCVEVFMSEEDLEDHKAAHHEEESEEGEDEAENAYVCSVCNDIFGNKKDLIEHKISKSECHEHRKCDKCIGESANVFSCIWELIDHAKAQHGLKDEDADYKIKNYLDDHKTWNPTDDCEVQSADSKLLVLSDSEYVEDLVTDKELVDDIMISSNQVQNLANECCDKTIESEVQQYLNAGGADIVDFVMKKSFRNFTHNDKILIKSLEMPRPAMKISASGQEQSFPVILFKQFDWLTGSGTRHKLFCWKCILFCHDSDNSWVPTDNLKELSRALKEHESTKDHIHATVKFILYGKRTIQTSNDAAYKENVRKFNEKVRENRAFLKRHIDMTIYLASHQGNVQELSEFMSLYDENFKKVSILSSKTIQNNLAKTIKAVVVRRIEHELRQSACFSWQVDTIANICHNAQLSIIVRYAFQGRVKERFLGFRDAANVKTADDLSALLINEFQHLRMDDKLVGQSYGGGPVAPAELSDLQNDIRVVAPQALLLHSRSHDLNSLLQDVTSTIEECGIFFAGLQEFASLFSNTKRTHLLNRIRGKGMPACADTKENFESKLANTVWIHRDSFMESLNYMLDSPQFERDEEVLRTAGVLIDNLNDFDFLFLLSTFNFIFEQTGVVLEVAATSCSIDDVLETLKCFRSEDHFDEIFQSCANILGPPSKKRKTDSGDYEDGYARLERIFKDILALTANQIILRFRNIGKLQFCDLLNPTKFAQFKNKFPYQLLHNLIDLYPKLFDKHELETQLRVVYSDPEILGNVSDLSQTLYFIYNHSLETVISEVHKLLSLVLSLPVMPASAKQSASTLKHVESFFMKSTSPETLSHSVIAIEKNFVEDLSNEATFYDNIIDHFAGATNYCIDLKYKAQL